MVRANRSQVPMMSMDVQVVSQFETLPMCKESCCITFAEVKSRPFAKNLDFFFRNFGASLVARLIVFFITALALFFANTANSVHLFDYRLDTEGLFSQVRWTINSPEASGYFLYVPGSVEDVSIDFRGKQFTHLTARDFFDDPRGTSSLGGCSLSFGVVETPEVYREVTPELETQMIRLCFGTPLNPLVSSITTRYLKEPGRSGGPGLPIDRSEEAQPRANAYISSWDCMSRDCTSDYNTRLDYSGGTVVASDLVPKSALDRFLIRTASSPEEQTAAHLKESYCNSSERWKLAKEATGILPPLGATAAAEVARNATFSRIGLVEILRIAAREAVSGASSVTEAMRTLIATVLSGGEMINRVQCNNLSSSHERITTSSGSTLDPGIAERFGLEFEHLDELFVGIGQSLEATERSFVTLSRLDGAISPDLDEDGINFQGFHLTSLLSEADQLYHEASTSSFLLMSEFDSTDHDLSIQLETLSFLLGRSRPSILIGGEGVTGMPDITECNGQTVSIFMESGDVPTAGPDVILGTTGDDEINARGGGDTICGRGGNDIINAGGGDDWIDGGSGNDDILGSAGNDTIFGGLGDDVIRGGSGDDDIDGEDGDDALLGQTGDDTIDGGDGVDDISGGAGSDTIYTGSGATVGSGVFVSGGGGNDTIHGGADADDLRGTAGVDIINGSGGDDLITGGTGRDEINGGDGDDDIRGQGSRDTINGDAGNDTINGGEENDIVNGGDGNDHIAGGRGNDILRGDSGADTVSGGLGDDTLVGGPSGGDICIGQSGTDTAAGSCESVTGVP